MNTTEKDASVCLHHNDQQRAACPVCLVATLTAERDQLRNLLVIALRSAGDQETRANRAEAELATERARLIKWLENDVGMDWQRELSRLTVCRAAINAAIKEGAK